MVPSCHRQGYMSELHVSWRTGKIIRGALWRISTVDTAIFFSDGGVASASHLRWHEPGPGWRRRNISEAGDHADQLKVPLRGEHGCRFRQGGALQRGL